MLPAEKEQHGDNNKKRAGNKYFVLFFLAVVADYIYIYMCVCVCVYVYTCMYVCVCVCLCVCIYIYIYIIYQLFRNKLC
jgi:hypothetical protein